MKVFPNDVRNIPLMKFKPIHPTFLETVNKLCHAKIKIFLHIRFFPQVTGYDNFILLILSLVKVTFYQGCSKDKKPIQIF